MAFSLSDRISNGRIRNDPGAGFRANTADFGVNFGSPDRGAFGAEQNPSMAPGGDVQMGGQPKGNPHSSAGFKRALMATERTAGRLSGAIASKKDFSSGNSRKPNYFGQGSRRHGLHIGSGAPATVPAVDSGSEFGGE